MKLLDDWMCGGPLRWYSIVGDRYGCIIKLTLPNADGSMHVVERVALTRDAAIALALQATAEHQ